MSDSKKSRARRIFNQLKSYWTSFRQSKIGKILFSNSLSYVVSVASIAIAASGLFTPISPIIIAVAVVSGVSVGIKAINETLNVHGLHKLHKENNLLVHNRNAKSQQDYILSLEPSLKDILKNELYTPQIAGKDCTQDKYELNVNKLKSTGRIFGNNLGGAANLAVYIIKGASGNVLDILKATCYGVVTTASLMIDGLTEKEKREIKEIFKLNINEEYKKQDTPIYENLETLEHYTKNQVLQTLALRKLITDKNYWSMNKDQKIQKFREIRGNFEIKRNGLEEFFKENKITMDNRKESYVKDIKNVMNPFYDKPSKAEVCSPLTKAMDKDKVNNAEIKRTKRENLKRMQKRKRNLTI
ncbi:hypothetical protein A1C_01845 [Rickettsia akari str. Hartford]|uniref:Uncharacterized protein n=1 Tax=Rickettsia akari (strain Hartford) TaxID=293614 RepID=A8GMQ5_RICAH|nr:hypothetical protein [Rickettsia akari]ABV74680.1 hypothetical protein A1C_01845 [Rickettsia akari str. Hartford]